MDPTGRGKPVLGRFSDQFRIVENRFARNGRRLLTEAQSVKISFASTSMGTDVHVDDFHQL